jgi:hypothetical protein
VGGEHAITPFLDRASTSSILLTGRHHCIGKIRGTPKRCHNNDLSFGV